MKGSFGIVLWTAVRRQGEPWGADLSTIFSDKKCSTDLAASQSLNKLFSFLLLVIILWLIIVYYYYFEESFGFTFEERQTESGSNDVFCKEKIFNFAIKIRVYFKKNILESFSITFASIMDNLFILKSRYRVLKKKKRENMSNQRVKYCMRLTIISC